MHSPYVSSKQHFKTWKWSVKWCEVLDFQSNGWLSICSCWPYFSFHGMQPISYSYWVWAHLKKTTQTIYYPHLAMKASSISWRARSRLFGHSAQPRWQLTWGSLSLPRAEGLTFRALEEYQSIWWRKKDAWVSLSPESMNSNFSFACRGDADSSRQVDLYFSISSGGGPESMILIQGLQPSGLNNPVFLLIFHRFTMQE